MSCKYVVRQPIKDINKKIIGYEIQYYGENYAFGNDDANTNTADLLAADAVYSFIMQNSEKHFKGSLNFMTFTPTLLIKKTPYLFERDDLVIQIDDSSLLHPLAMMMVNQYAKAGYRIAVNDFQFSQRYMDILGLIDYIKIDVSHLAEESIDHIVTTASGMHKKCIAIGVSTEAIYKKVYQKEFVAFEGTYVAQQVSCKVHSSEYLKSNFFRLMMAVTNPEPDIEEIENIISIDATLTFGILKIVNSCYFAMRKRVNTVRQAIMTMGLREMKQWVYLLNATGGETDATDEGVAEILRISFVRANFCSRLMQYTRNMPITKPDAYLMGMLSTLNYLIDAPLIEILDDIPLQQEIKDALLEKKGDCGLMYELVLCYERANWIKIDKIAPQLGVPTNMLTNIYFECVEEAERVWKEVTTPMEQMPITV